MRKAKKRVAGIILMLAISLFGCTSKNDTTTEVNDKDKIRL